MKLDNNETYKKIKEIVSSLPWYVEEYIKYKMRKLAQTTLLNYCHDYKIFFLWLAKNDEYNAKKISLEDLQRLSVIEIEEFLNDLTYNFDNKPITINRKLSSLKSLFNYLQNIAEHKDFSPYLNRNVMAKIEFNNIKEDMETIANKMEGKILLGDEYEEFRLFVASNYIEACMNNKRKINYYRINKERDTAIISLILGSGLRLSEVVQLDLSDIDFVKNTARVIRKGNKEQYVYFSDIAADDLKEYIKIRIGRYEIEKSQKALFIAAKVGPEGKSRRLTNRSIEKIVEKYATAYGKPSLTVHKLRHSFATRYHQEVNDVPKLRRQLGHSAIQTTMIYTHIRNEDLRKAVNKMEDF